MLAHLYGEEAARSMSAAAMGESIRAIVRDCSHVSLPPSLPAASGAAPAYGQKDST